MQKGFLPAECFARAQKGVPAEMAIREGSIGHTGLILADKRRRYMQRKTTSWTQENSIIFDGLELVFTETGT